MINVAGDVGAGSKISENVLTFIVPKQQWWRKE